MNLKTEKIPSQERVRGNTEAELRCALLRLQKKAAKISISAVAKEAGVTPALLHNRYPDLTEEIRSLIGKATRAQRDEKQEALVFIRTKNRLLREQIEGLLVEITRLASVNESLRAELVLQTAIAKKKVIPISYKRP